MYKVGDKVWLRLYRVQGIIVAAYPEVDQYWIQIGKNQDLKQISSAIEFELFYIPVDSN